MVSAENNPPTCFPAALSDAVAEGPWWVAHTKARQEKAFARDLIARRIAYFLPMTQRSHLVRGRRVSSMLPLFSSYVFVRSTPEKRLDSMRTGRLAGAIQVADQEKLDRELRHIEKLLAGKAVLEPWRNFPKGSRCRVIAGPFEGIEGVVQTRRAVTRLVLTVENLGQAVALEIDEGLLEPVDD